MIDLAIGISMVTVHIFLIFLIHAFVLCTQAYCALAIRDVQCICTRLLPVPTISIESQHHVPDLMWPIGRPTSLAPPSPETLSTADLQTLDYMSSDSDETMPIVLKDIRRISELYKTATLAVRAGVTTKYSVKASLLDRVSLLWALYLDCEY